MESFITSENDIETRDEKARRNREKYPEVAAMVDEIRKHFPNARVTAIRQLTEAQSLERWKQRMGKKYQAQASRGPDAEV